MSAIAGIFNRSGRQRSPQEINAMLGVMAARGPDRRSTWKSGPITFGHGLLIATPEAAHEPQPFTDPVSGNTITADIRLDNRGELIAKLGFAGRRTEQPGDAELALAAYSEWGTDCGSRLLGAFALAIWDEEEQKLVLIRDHFGVRPLVNFVSDELFVFGSDARAILTVDGVPRELNRDRVLDFLIPSIESVEVNATFFKSIERLTPAHSMEVRAADLSVKPYWELREPPVLRLAGTTEYIEAHNAIFGEAVRCRLRGRDDAGVMLSGGIDSAAIAAFSASQGATRAYSAVSTEPCEPETRRINLAAEALGLALHTVTQEETNQLLGSFSTRVKGAENLFSLHQTLSTAVFRKAAVGSQRSLLSGIFANEVTQESLRHVFGLLWADRRFGAALLQLDPTGKLLRQMGIKEFVRMVGSAASPRVRRNLDAIGQARWDQARSRKLDAAHLAFHPGERGRLERMMDRQRRQVRANDGPGTNRAELFARHYAAAGLERYDIDAAGQSIEVRSPYMDRRVVEFWLSLPAEQLVWRGWDKVLLRRSMDDRVPRDLAWCRSNEHLGYSFTRAWLDFVPGQFLHELRGDHPVRSLVDRATSASSIASGDENRDLSLACLALWLDSAGKAGLSFGPETT